MTLIVFLNSCYHLIQSPTPALFLEGQKASINLSSSILIPMELSGNVKLYKGLYINTSFNGFNPLYYELEFPRYGKWNFLKNYNLSLGYTINLSEKFILEPRMSFYSIDNCKLLGFYNIKSKGLTFGTTVGYRKNKHLFYLSVDGMVNKNSFQIDDKKNKITPTYYYAYNGGNIMYNLGYRIGNKVFGDFSISSSLKLNGVEVEGNNKFNLFSIPNVNLGIGLRIGENLNEKK